MQKVDKIFQQALLDPTEVFSSPEEVIENKKLSKEQKLTILDRWKYDAISLNVAEEENMTAQNNDNNILERVLKAQRKLENE